MLRVDARPHKLYPPTCRQVEPKRKLPFGLRSGLSEQYVRWGATETFLPAAHDHPMCYESMLRGKRWTYGPRTRYVPYPPAGRQQENSEADHPPHSTSTAPTHIIASRCGRWEGCHQRGSPLLPPAPMPMPPGKGASSTPRRAAAIERIGGACADAPTADGLLLCSVALSVAPLRASTRCR